MRFPFFRSTKRPWQIGIDMTDEEIRMVGIQMLNKKPQLTCCGTFPRSDLAGFQQAMKHPEIAGGDKRISMRCEGLALQKIHIPQVPMNEVEAVLSWELQKQGGFSESEYTAKVLTTLTEPSANADGRVSYLVFIILNEKLEQCRKEMLDLGLPPPNSLEPSITGLALCATQALQLGDGERAALLDVDDQKAEFLVLDAQCIRYARTLGGGGTNKLIQSMTSNLGVDKATAERFLVDCSQEDEGHQQIIRSSISQHISGLARDMAQSIEAYGAEIGSVPLTKLHLTGVGSKSADLRRELQVQLNLQIELLDPFANVEVGQILPASFEFQANPYAVALGLAL